MKYKTNKIAALLNKCKTEIILLFLLFLTAQIGPKVPKKNSGSHVEIIHTTSFVKKTSISDNLYILSFITTSFMFIRFLYRVFWIKKNNRTWNNKKDSTQNAKEYRIKKYKPERRANKLVIVYQAKIVYIKRLFKLDNIIYVKHIHYTNESYWNEILLITRQLIEKFTAGEHDPDSRSSLILQNLFRIEKEVAWNVYPGRAKIKIWHEEIYLWLREEKLSYNTAIEIYYLLGSLQNLLNGSDNKIA